VKLKPHPTGKPLFSVQALRFLSRASYADLYPTLSNKVSKKKKDRIKQNKKFSDYIFTLLNPT
jgi:hypothetical protein